MKREEYIGFIQDPVKGRNGDICPGASTIFKTMECPAQYKIRNKINNNTIMSLVVLILNASLRITTNTVW